MRLACWVWGSASPNHPASRSCGFASCCFGAWVEFASEEKLRRYAIALGSDIYAGRFGETTVVVGFSIATTDWIEQVGAALGLGFALALAGAYAEGKGAILCY